VTRTYLDSDVLLVGWRGREPDRARAIDIMSDLEREFVSSQTVRLELLPKADFHRNTDEVAFYEMHFGRLKSEEPLTEELGNEAITLARRYGLAAVDALHVAAAIRQGAIELITGESPGKPLFRVRELKVKTIFQG
jgi:predicted nucleic acid-binding protein